MAKPINMEVAGLVLLGLAEVPQVMSAFLPSPTTAYMGGSDPIRVAWLRRGEVIGGAVSMGIAVSISLIVRPSVGPSAWYITAGAAFVLALFLAEYERALRMGERDNGPDHVPGQGY